MNTGGVSTRFGAIVRSVLSGATVPIGYTIQHPTEDRYLMTRRELERKIAVLLGGRAAEKRPGLVFG